MADHRFRRRLTEAEMAELQGLAREPVSCFMALWNIILGEAEGTTWERATENRQRFDVSRYAIPRDQEAQLQAWLCHRQPKHRRLQVMMAFLDIGPATYQE